MFISLPSFDQLRPEPCPATPRPPGLQDGCQVGLRASARAEMMCVFENEKATVTRMHDGKEVGFCCRKCATKWDAMSDAEKNEALEKKKH